MSLHIEYIVEKSGGRGEYGYRWTQVRSFSKRVDAEFFMRYLVVVKQKHARIVKREQELVEQ